MRTILITMALALLLAAPVAGQELVPLVEKAFNGSAGWRFSGYSGLDQTPELIEIKANGGLLLVTFHDTRFVEGVGINVKKSIPMPQAPWWTVWLSGPNLGNTVQPIGASAFTVDSEVRPFRLAGAGVDSLTITHITASSSLVTLSRELGN